MQISELLQTQNSHLAQKNQKQTKQSVNPHRKTTIPPSTMQTTLLTHPPPLYKSLCPHWQHLPTRLTFPSLKETFTWVSLQPERAANSLTDPSTHHRLSPNVPTIKVLSINDWTIGFVNCNLFANRYSLVIVCVTCRKEIFDLYGKSATKEDINLIVKENAIRPFAVRSYFTKPIDEETMFCSNLEYPKSFQKQKKNCTLFVSQTRTTFIEAAIRFLAFIPTFNSISQSVDPQKIRSPTLRSLLTIINTMSTGQHRILKLGQFQDTFFVEFPEFLSYENRKPISVLFKLFTVVENEFRWVDSCCEEKEVVSDERAEWQVGNNVGKYSPLREMLLSRFRSIQQCPKCLHSLSSSCPPTLKQFQCLKIQPLSLSSSLTFTKRKPIQLNIIKAIESTLLQAINSPEQQVDPLLLNRDDYPQETSCPSCGSQVEPQERILIKPGNYLLFQIDTKDSSMSKMVVPKVVNLHQIDKKRFLVDGELVVFEFVASIYRDVDDSSQHNGRYMYAQEHGVVVYHNQNKKYLNFSERNYTEHETLLLEKCYTTLIYKRRPNDLNLPIIKNIKSTLYLIGQQELQCSNPVPLPDFYDIYLSQHFRVPPFLNPYVCHHGRRNIAIEGMTKCKKLNLVPVEIYNFLVDVFGGRKVDENSGHGLIEECKVCLKGIEVLGQLKKIQKEVMKYVDNFSVKKGQVMIYKQWLEKWKSYLYEKPKENYTQWGNPLPSQIDNFLGMKDKNPKTIDYKKYTNISVEVWLALSMFHSGGPRLNIKKVANNNSVKNYVQLRLDQCKALYAQLGKCLSIEGRKLLKTADIANIGTIISSTVMQPIKQEQQDQLVNSNQVDIQNQTKQLQHTPQRSQLGKRNSVSKEKSRLFSREKSRL